jgi:D-amino-acid dehydrogenase
LVLALGHPELLREEGHYVLWESPSTSAAGRAVWERTDIGEARMAALDAGALERIAALLHRPPAGGVRFTGTGQISDPGLALEALRTAVIAQGGRFRQARVHRLQEREGRASLELVDGERLDADTILVAAGVGSGPLMRSVGHLAPLIAERGYHLEGEAAGWPEPLPPIVFEDRFLIVTRFGARLRATSFVELARHGSPPDPRKWARLERHVEELGLPMGAPRGRWMGSRPTLPDYLPAIGVSRRASNLIYAFGHQHLGLTLAATTGEIIAALLGEAIPPTEVSAFALERFEAAGSRSRNRRGDPRARIAA